MPTDKRQRQKQGRLERMEAERRAASRQAKRRRFVTGVGIAIVVVTILAFIALFGEGDRDEEEDVATDEGGTSTEVTEPTDEETTGSTAPPTDPLVCAPGAGEAGEGPPVVTVPTGDLPTELSCTDVQVGDGPAAAPGDTLEVNYTGINASNAEQFDSSFDGEPFTFELGAGNVIPGWDQGLVGMQEGGRRTLLIPPDLAYGEQGRPGIPPDETLVFVIDLLGVTKP